MPKKSIREMNTWELLHYSLQTKVFRSILVSMVVLGLVTLVIGLGLYSWSLVNQYIRDIGSRMYRIMDLTVSDQLHTISSAWH